MLKKIKRPSNPYSPEWSLYWKQNPTMRRGVGADGVDDDDEAATAAAAAKAAADKAAADEAAAALAAKDDDKDDKDKGDNKPSDSEAKLLKEVMAKKEKLKAQDTELSDLKTQLKKFDGIDLDQVSQLLKDASEAETKKLEDKGAWDALKAQMVEQQDANTKTLKDEIVSLKDQLAGNASTIDKLTVGHAFDASKYIGDTLTLTPGKARIIYGQNFDVEGDGIVAYDKPKGAAGRVQLVDASGSPLPFELAIAKMVDADPDRDHLVKSKVKPGADSKTDNGKITTKPVQLKGADRIAAALNKN